MKALLTHYKSGVGRSNATFLPVYRRGSGFLPALRAVTIGDSLKESFRSRIFLAGLAARIVCLPFFGAHYLHDFFIPFLDKAVTNPGVNPWSNFPPHYFPYGSILFALIAAPRWLAYQLF